MSQKPVLILGASSSIAREVSVQFALHKHPLILAGRRMDELERLKSDLSIRYQVPVATAYLDAEEMEMHPSFFSAVFKEHPEIEGIFCAIGYLGNHEQALHEWEEAAKILNNNFVGICSLLLHASKELERRGSGWIGVITSVAGDRGRKSNYYYGASKGALGLFLQGLDHRLGRTQIRVVDIKLGFVETRMTGGKTPKLLTVSPSAIAPHIYKALQTKRGSLYLPWFWKPLMAVIKAIPRKIFNRLEL